MGRPEGGAAWGGHAATASSSPRARAATAEEPAAGGAAAAAEEARAPAGPPRAGPCTQPTGPWCPRPARPPVASACSVSSAWDCRGQGVGVLSASNGEGGKSTGMIEAE